MPAARSFDADRARRLRMSSLLLGGRATAAAGDTGARAGEPLEVVRWLGAMQAQDLTSVQWSFGVRWPGSTLADVDAAFQRGELLRTWPMRGTIHAIAAEDARWMLELCTGRALQGVERRRQTLGITEAMAVEAGEVLRSALVGGNRLTRSACVELLSDAGLATQAGHGYHYLWFASQVGITCIGPQEGKEQTFALLDEWAPEQRQLNREGSLAEIARRFVRGRGPVSRGDLAGWTGLLQGDVKRGIELLGDEVVEVDVDGQAMWMTADLLERADDVFDAHDPTRPWLLTGFDEVALGYKDRSLFVDPVHQDRIIPGNNGMFRSTMVVDGKAIGTWTRTVKRSTVVIDAEPFGRTTAALRQRFAAPAEDYGRFVGCEAELRWP